MLSIDAKTTGPIRKKNFKTYSLRPRDSSGEKNEKKRKKKKKKKKEKKKSDYFFRVFFFIYTSKKSYDLLFFYPKISLKNVKVQDKDLWETRIRNNFLPKPPFY